MMKDLILGFGPQLLEGLAIAREASLNKPKQNISNVVIAGMGGSGIGGNLIKALTNNTCTVPIEVSKSYDIPGYVGENTLFIACSFSGNTEETLAAADLAKAKGAQIVAITSGGKMGDFAKSNGYDCIHIPGRSNSPRASIGYSFIQILLILNHFGLIPQNHFNEVEASAALLENEQKSIQAKARELTAHFKNKLPIMYGDSKMEAVLVRAQQQIAENSKQMSHVNVMPEMNHNELVGWDHAKVIFANTATLLLRTSFDHSRTSVRMNVCKGIFEKVAGKVMEIEAKGDSFLEQCMYLNHILDWTSFFLAEENDVDPFPVDVINYLKNELAKV